MAGKFLTSLALLLAIAGSCRAGFAATYAGYHPAYATYQAPAVYHAAPVAHAPAVYHAAPVAQAPAVYHQAAPVLTKTVLPAAAPLYTKAYAVPSPFVKAAVAAPVAPVAVAAPLAPVAVTAPLAPVAVAAPVLKQVEYESSPRYDFSYGVHDSITGDIKSQVETRDGGNVVGSYSVLDADGYKRTVTYTADDINGFNAVVQREPVVAARALATPVVSAPVAVAAPAPVAVAAPAPVASFQSPIYYPHQQVFAPQQVQQVQPVVEQQGEVVEAPVATPPELEPTPIDYNEGQEQQQQQQQPTYPQDQQFPPFSPAAAPAPDSDDSDVVEARSAPEASSTTSTTVAPAPVTEENKKTA